VIPDARFRVSGLKFRVTLEDSVIPDARFRVLGSGFRVLGRLLCVCGGVIRPFRPLGYPGHRYRNIRDTPHRLLQLALAR
jgi:hypothetical protein